MGRLNFESQNNRDPSVMAGGGAASPFEGVGRTPQQQRAVSSWDQPELSPPAIRTPSSRFRTDPRYDSNDSLDALQTQPSFTSGGVAQAGKEAFNIFRLAAKLLGYLGLGWKWMMALWQLIMFALVLMPGFLQMVVFYFLSSRIRRSVRYGAKARNTLDVYVPKYRWLTEEGPRPVVIYITGGAWTIGYKAWGALVGRRLSQRGVLVFCLDYRNFPQGTATDMLEDVNTGIRWVLNMCRYYGGDADQIFIVSQSAGAQLAGLALFKQAQRECRRQNVSGAEPQWDTKQIKGFVGVSGAYDLQELHTHLHKRGMYKSLLQDIFTVNGQVAYKELSPTYAVQDMTLEEWTIIPPILLLHGTKDRTVPPKIAQSFLRAIKSAGGRADLCMYEGKTHTSPIVEDPLCGKDLMLDEILSMITGEETHMTAFPMVPGILAWVAGLVSPF